MKYVALLLIAMSMLLCNCGKDKSTQPEPQSSIYLSRLVVSMVPGASETVIIHSTGSVGEFEVSHSASEVSSATISDSTIEITGLSYGIDTLTISSSSGASRVLPVQVYNYRVIDTGELLISYTDQFQSIYSFSPAGWNPVCFYKPIPPEGFYALGSYARGYSTDPNGNAAVMVVQAKPGSDAIVFTTDFTNLGPYLHNPIAPEGYKAMGQVCTGAYQTPDPAVCIREDLTTPGTCYLFWSYENNYHQVESAWGIYQPSADLHENAYLAPGMFIYESGIDDPTGPLINVLNVSLPMLAEAPSQDYVPSLSSYDVPSDGVAPRMEKCLMVPCTIVKDGQYSSNMPWRIANSPFYRLERQVFYKYINHYDNSQGSVPQAFHWAITIGMSATESQTVWGETGVELSVEAGVSIYAVQSSITATVSRKFGYETMNSITELQTNTLTIDVNIPAHKAGALWQRYNRYVLYRHNGTELEQVTSWECGINSYVYDEYPDN